MKKKVLVVGAGPVGLVCALALAKAGVDVTIVEAEECIVESPRAMGYHWPVLDGLDALGLVDDMKEEGFVLRDFAFRMRETGEQVVFNASVLDGRTEHPYMLVLGQNKFARVALRHVERHLNARVAWQTKFKSLEQDCDSVTVRTMCDGVEKTYQADWLIAADGARSEVRKALGLSFDGMTWPNRFIATNIYFDFDKYGWGQMGYLLDPNFGAVIGKLDKEGLWRVMFSEGSDLPTETIERRIVEFLRNILPGKEKFELGLYSGYAMHQRSAGTYRVGRALLAGDSAHATNPTSGYGLVGGLFDAYLLVDTLLGVIGGAVDESVLDRYSEARRNVFEQVTSPVSTSSMSLVFHSENSTKLEKTFSALRARAENSASLLEWYQTQERLESKSLLTGERVQLSAGVTR